MRELVQDCFWGKSSSNEWRCHQENSRFMKRWGCVKQKFGFIDSEARPSSPFPTPPFPNSSILQSWSSDSEQWCGIRCCCARKDGNDVLSLYGVFSGTKGMHEPSERKYVIMKSATSLIAKSRSVGVIKKKLTQRRIHPSIHPSIHQNTCL